MGRPLARRLAAAGFAVTGWNRSPLPPELADGIALAAGLAEAAAAGTVVLMLSDSAATGEVLGRLEPHLAAGALVVDMGSSESADSRARAAALAARGVGWVDAPVSGGPGGAEAGTLAIMAGGLDADFERALPLLRAVGGSVAHVGGPGAGHALKVVNQLIVALSTETVAEALALAAALGFDAQLVQAAVRGGSADNPQLRVTGTRMGARDYAPRAKVRTLLKDLRMAGRLADELGLDLPQLRLCLSLYEGVVERGRGDDDVAVLYELQAPDGRLR